MIARLTRIVANLKAQRRAERGNDDPLSIHFDAPSYRVGVYPEHGIVEWDFNPPIRVDPRLEDDEGHMEQVLRAPESDWRAGDISSSVEFERCADCESTSVALLGDNGMLYCLSCADEYLNCQRCNQLAIGGRSRVNGVELCDECFDRDD